MGSVPVQTCPWHVSVSVQALPSSQGVPVAIDGSAQSTLVLTATDSTFERAESGPGPI
jgi:hypothetical protein